MQHRNPLRIFAVLLIAVVTNACGPSPGPSPEGFSFDIDPQLVPLINPP
ncbi:MAG TPA: hypothetical protein VG055_06870 [Planctomycetaceae bacterium]|nr:hypothetical protein [Planctomycetaceae bacterium]